MLNKFLAFCCLTIFLSLGCQARVPGVNISTPEIQSNNQVAPNTTVAPTILPEINSTRKCLQQTSLPPISNSIIVGRSLKNVVSGEYPDLYIVDLSEIPSKQTIQKINITSNFAISPNRRKIAYLSSAITNGKPAQPSLIIANANFQIQNIISFSDHWNSILGWTLDQRVIISTNAENTLSSFVSLAIIDPQQGNQQSIDIHISDFIGNQFSAPYWDGWHGSIVDPTLARSIYLKQSNYDLEKYTYSLWDIENSKPIISLEKYIAGSLYFSEAAQKPVWSPDGGQFAVAGMDQNGNPGKSGWFIVHINGTVKQITNLTNIAYIWPLTTWSPDNKSIVVLATWQEAMGSDLADVYIVNPISLDVTDLCLQIGVPETNPIWSPSGKQFLIVDKYDKDHQRVLLADTEKSVYYQLGEDIEPMGWMTSP
jgi:hypothetical protein